MTSDEAPTPRASRADSLSTVGVALACAALIFSIVGLGLAFEKVDKAKNLVGGSTPSEATVTLTDFKIAPETVILGPGGTLQIRNKGAVVHDLAVKDTALRTPMIAIGAAATLDVSSLAPGDYVIICEVPGHESAGMTARLHISVTAGTSATAMADMPGMTSTTASGTTKADQMDATMAVRTKAFPAATKGTGAVELAPTVLTDGTKQFELTTSQVDWEVEPGKVVKAMAYNGIVPGPTMRVAVGDRVKIVVTNKMDESTSVHFHGLILPNAMDGVPDITQAPIKPGQTFTYEFVAKGPAVAMYHSHQNAVTQVPDGLAGAFYVGSVPLPPGVPTPALDLPMILNDAGTIGFSLNGKSFPATAPVVVKQGQWIKMDYMNEGLQIHPMHLHGMPQVIIARDGYPLANPVTEDTVNVAPGQRVTVLIHATEPGTWAWHCHILSHAETADGMFGMVTALIVK